jgi:hypothetical protein
MSSFEQKRYFEVFGLIARLAHEEKPFRVFPPLLHMLVEERVGERRFPTLSSCPS